MAGIFNKARRSLLIGTGAIAGLFTKEASSASVPDTPVKGEQAALESLLSGPTGSAKIGFEDRLTTTYLKTVSDILNAEPVSIARFIDPRAWSQITARRSKLDVTAAFNTAIAGGVLRLQVPDGLYHVSAPIDARQKAGLEIEGLGLPTISQQASNTPIFLVGGERLRLEGFQLKFAAMPTAQQVDAVAVRAYNLYESILRRLYIVQVHTGIDQFQGAVEGRQNAFFSNTLAELRIIGFAGWAARLRPYGGGNSGNHWNNVYINNRGNGVNAADSAVCMGGIWLQTAQNDVFNLLNIEWMRNTRAAIVLNQAGNPVFNGLHFEGLHPVTPSMPLVDILGGDNSCPTFNGLTLTGCDFGGAAGQGLFRLDSQGTRVKVSGLLSSGNNGQDNMKLLINGGNTYYGSVLEVDNANVDGALSTDAYMPKVIYGKAMSGVEIPLQRWNQNMARHTALVQDNGGGNAEAGQLMAGTIGSPHYDAMGLWDTGKRRFNIKQAGNYLCTALIPRGTAPVIQVRKTGVVVATIAPDISRPDGIVQISLERGDNVEFYLASGSFARNNVTFGVSLLG